MIHNLKINDYNIKNVYYQWNIDIDKTLLFSHSRCNVCDTLFNTSMSLEYHKEEFGHWTSDDDDDYDDDEEIGKY